MIKKLKDSFKKIADLFTGLFNLASYTEQQKAVNDSLKDLTTQMVEVAKGMNENTLATKELTVQLNQLDKEITKIKDGLQIELFGSLQALHTKLIEQHYATVEQKREAELYYTQIHNLGKDGWSEKYYQEIIRMPESRDEYWRQLNDGN